MSMKEAIWPIFIAAPFISPSTEAIFSAVSMWRVSSRSLRLLVGAGQVGGGGPRVAGGLAADARCPSFAERPIRRLRDLRLLLLGLGRLCAGPAAEAGSRISTPQGSSSSSRERALCSSGRSCSRSLLIASSHFLSWRPSVHLSQAACAGASSPIHSWHRPSHTQGLASREIRLAGHPPPAPGGPRARRRLRPGRRGAALPGPRARAAHAAPEGQTLLDLEIDGSKAVPVVIKEQQHHPVRGEVIHLDCLEVRLDEEIQSEVPIELEGAEQAPASTRAACSSTSPARSPSRRCRPRSPSSSPSTSPRW